MALITPLRDGMNLVAKEFVACQDDDDPGVLILSPFAGAGGIMQEALQVREALQEGGLPGQGSRVGSEQISV